MLQRRLAVVVPLVSFFLVMRGGADQQAESFAGSQNPHIRLYANILRQSIWPSTRIFVCWENPSEAAPNQLEFVKNAVAGTWSRASALHFVGWEQCAEKNAGIRIKIDDSGPHTKGLGKNLDRRPDGMVLNFTFRSWGQSCAAMREYCVKGIAVHEFGHAIGFAHEQNRHDGPGECQVLRQGTDGDLLLTPYDKTSVMNYCNRQYNNDGELSPLDAAAVREIYGAPQ
jgi:Astacin (Peptidase family M12A)